MSCAGELGIVAMTNNEVVVNQQLHVFIPTERIAAAFLLNTLAYRKDQIESYGTKTAVPYLNKNSCNSIPIPLPPIQEQRVIATALSDVDALLVALERLVAKKRDLKQAAMQQLLTGQTRLAGFSGEWEETTLGAIGECIIGLTYHPDFAIVECSRRTTGLRKQRTC
jgi:type I restriction enzyme S subunit